MLSGVTVLFVSLGVLAAIWIFVLLDRNLLARRPSTSQSAWDALLGK
jgi:hypothetical protein